MFINPLIDNVLVSVTLIMPFHTIEFTPFFKPMQKPISPQRIGFLSIHFVHLRRNGAYMFIPSCTICPRQCGVVRDNGRSKGVCGMPVLPTVARAALHYGEEPCITGQNGSGTVFFSGCSLHCIFCQNHTISHEQFGETVTIQRLADIFRELTEQGAHNINLVNPTHFVPAILEALKLYRPPVPIIYNSSGYERVETLRTLEGTVDIYLPDLKYVHSEIAAQFSRAADYFAYASAAIMEMARQTGSMILDVNGLAVKGTMVRHLVLPGHTKESIAVLDWLSEHLPAGIWVSLLFQYTPILPLDAYPELNRRLTARECNKVWDHMLELGLTDGYVQERASAGEKYIPLFDLTGVQI